MADGGVDIDLYADVEQEFPNDELNENTDLYDDVLTAGKKVIFIRCFILRSYAATCQHIKEGYTYF